jgi:hypothetical protein
MEAASWHRGTSTDGGRCFANTEATMKWTFTLGAAIVLLASPLFAQDVGRPQDGFYSGQSNGQVDGRVDGRGSHNEGLPPSAADKDNRLRDNPISQSDCAEVDAVAPDARLGWQARVRAACPQ